MATTITVVNQKGGVAKSTTVINLAAGLARRGQRVLVVDLDPQQNTASVLLGEKDVTPNLYQVMVEDQEPAEAIHPPSEHLEDVEGLRVLPGHIDLTAADLLLGNKIGRETLLRKRLAPIKDRFDFILIDTPPSLGLLTVNALTTADELMVPVSVSYFSLQGLQMLQQTIEMVRDSLEHDLEINHVLCTFFDSSTNISKDALSAVKQRFGDKVLQTIIPKNVDLEYAHSNQTSIFEYAPDSRGGRAYKRLASELIRRLT